MDWQDALDWFVRLLQVAAIVRCLWLEGERPQPQRQPKP